MADKKTMYTKATEESINELRELISTYEGYGDLRNYILKTLDRMMIESSSKDEAIDAMVELEATIIMCGMAKGIDVEKFFKQLLYGQKGGERR